MTLADLALRLRRFADGELPLDELRLSFLPAFEADPLDPADSDGGPWEEAPDDSRLYWRLLHLFDTAGEDDAPALRRLASRLVTAIDDAGSATTFELLPLLIDQDRFCTIVARHASGVISRTAFLSVLAESGYPPHLKLWLQHAPPDGLAMLCRMLADGRIAQVAVIVESHP